MDLYIHARFQPLHQWLTSRQQTLLARMARHLGADSGRGSGNSDHRTAMEAIHGAKLPVQSAGQAARDMRELVEIRNALHRMELGTYGKCEDCGEPISMMRLVSHPASPCCTACESSKEQAFEADSQFTLF